MRRFASFAVLVFMAFATVLAIGPATAPATALAASEANLSLSIDDSPDPTSVGGTLTYTVYVANNGPDAAAGVTMTDTLDPSMTFQSSNPTSPTCNASGSSVTCSLGTVAAFGSRTVTIVVTPGQAGFINNSATTSTTSTDPDPSDNSATIDTQVNQQATADISISLSHTPDPVQGGQVLHYTIDVANNGGPDDATGVTVTDTLPSSMTFLSSSPAAPTCVNSSGTVTCHLGTLALYANKEVTINVRATTAGSIDNTASVSSAELDPNLSDNSATTNVTVNVAPPPAVSIGNASTVEGDSGRHACMFVVKLSAASGEAVSVHFATLNGSAKSPGDYAAKSGTLNFTPGSTSRKLPISVKGDRLHEKNEVFYVKLSGPVKATLGKAKGACTIKNDD